MNAFEIRLEVLRMANDTVNHNFCMKREAIIDDWRNEVEQIRATSPSGKIPKCPVVEPPSTAEILKKAEDLYKFVSSQG
jgi:hypothetical protein